MNTRSTLLHSISIGFIFRLNERMVRDLQGHMDHVSEKENYSYKLASWHVIRSIY